MHHIWKYIKIVIVSCKKKKKTVFHNIKFFLLYFWSKKCTLDEHKRPISKTLNILPNPNFATIVYVYIYSIFVTLWGMNSQLWDVNVTFLKTYFLYNLKLLLN